MIGAARSFFRLLHWLGVALTGFMAVVIATDAILRNAINSPIIGISELVANLLVVLLALQTPQVIASGRLLQVRFCLDALPKPIAKALATASYLIGAAVFLAIAWYGWDSALRSFVRDEFLGNVLLKIPAWPIRFTTLFLWVVSAAACLIAALALWRDQQAASSQLGGTP